MVEIQKMMFIQIHYQVLLFELCGNKKMLAPEGTKETKVYQEI